MAWADPLPGMASTRMARSSSVSRPRIATIDEPCGRSSPGEVTAAARSSTRVAFTSVSASSSCWARTELSASGPTLGPFASASSSVTPVASNFTYYGQRKIRLVKDGYETLTVMQSVPAPWYQIPPLDFVSENLVPGRIRDTQTFSYQLTPQRVVPTDELLRRGEGLRHGTHTIGTVAPVAATETLPVGPALSGPPPTLPAEPIPFPQDVGGRAIQQMP